MTQTTKPISASSLFDYNLSGCFLKGGIPNGISFEEEDNCVDLGRLASSG